MAMVVAWFRFLDTSSHLTAKLSNLNLDRLDSWVGPPSEDLILSDTKYPSIGTARATGDGCWRSQMFNCAVDFCP